MMRVIFTLFAVVNLVLGNYVVKTPEIEVGTPKGVTFSYRKDDPGLSLVAFHFNVNTPLAGTAASEYAKDVTTETDGLFVYTEPNVQVTEGDVIYYWIYTLVDGRGYVLTDQSYKYAKPTTTTTTRKTTTKSTTTRVTNPQTGSTTTRLSSEGTTSASTENPGECGECQCEQKVKCESYPCLIFEDNFDRLDLATWEHEITAGGGGNWEFQYYTNNRSNSYVKDGVLHLKPTLTEDKTGINTVTQNGMALELWGHEPANLCTGNQWWGCKRDTYLPVIINPIQSARIRTINSFSFRYGRLEVEAKLPKGDWIWPAIWLLPKYQFYNGWPASGEIDLMESRGNTKYFDSEGINIGVEQIGSTLHYGPFWPENGWPFAHASYNIPSGTFNDDFHRFRVDWDKEGFKFYIDDTEFLNVETGDGYWQRGGFGDHLPDKCNVWAHGENDAPFDQEFYIIMNVAVGGTGGYFPDAATNQPHPKPWNDASSQASYDFWLNKNNWYSTWPQGEEEDDRAMQINYVRAWKMTPEQDGH